MLGGCDDKPPPPARIAQQQSVATTAAALDEPDPAPRVLLSDESGFTRSEQDGGGSVELAPVELTAGAPCTLRFTYTVGGEGIAAGGGVLCYVTRFWGWMPPQVEAPDRPGYVTVVCSREDARIELRCDAQNQAVLAHIGEPGLRPGDTLLFTYGDTSGGRFPQAQGRADRYAEREERFYFKVDGDGDGWFAPLARQSAFDVQAREAVRLVVFGPSACVVGEAFELRVSALDALNNLAERFVGEVALALDEALFEAPASVAFGSEARGSVGVPITPRAAGMGRIAAQDAARALRAGVSNTLLVHEPGPREFRLVWADLQIHGNRSDGTGSPRDIYRYARDVARLDAASLTEHDHWGYLPLDEHPQVWAEILDTSRAFDEPGRFVALPGYEWTNWTFGHKHVLFAREQDARLLAFNDPRYDHPLELWDALRGVDCVTISHHIGGGPVPTFWKYHDATLEPVAEMVSTHGVSERMGQPGCIYSAEPSGMMQAALARGHRLGMIGGGDTHDGHPGLGSPGAPPPGLAGLYVRELTRAGVLEALRARRCYATNGCRAILRFHSGDTPMGGVLRIAEPGSPRVFDVALVGDAPIRRVTIVKNNEDAAAFESPAATAPHGAASEPGAAIATRQWSDTLPAADGDYYYVRAEQQDGGWIWSSPIWTRITARD